MNAGSLRHRVVIQNIVETQDEATGVVSSVPATFATVWADIRPASVKEFVEAGVSGSRVTSAIKIRYLAGVKPSMHVIHGGKTYNIEGVLPDPKTGLEYLTLPCSEIQHG